MRTRLRRLSAATAVLALCAASAQAQEAESGSGAFYAAIRGGANWSPDGTLKGSFRATDDRGTGWAFGGAVGYDFKPFRIELELLRRGNDLKGLDVTRDGSTGFALGLPPLSGAVNIADRDVKALSTMVNAIYDVPTSGRLHPYVGAGIGFALVDLDYEIPGSGFLLESDRGALAVQGIAGVEYALSDRLSADLGYRYLTTTETSLRLAGGVRADGRYSAHNLLVGLRYSFGGAPRRVRPTPAPTPAAAPAATVNQAPRAVADHARVRAGEAVTIDVLANDRDPDGRITGIATIEDGAHGRVTRAGDGRLHYEAEPRFLGRDQFRYSIQDDAGAVAEAIVTVDVLAPEVGPFLVFFDFDKADLRADAAPILDEAAAAFERYGFVRIAVVGHTDRAGPDAYNQRLSERRAAAVKAALAARGVPAEQIVTAGHGESEPLVPTEDGVREPQNRRVEITFPAVEGGN